MEVGLDSKRWEGDAMHGTVYKIRRVQIRSYLFRFYIKCGPFIASIHLEGWDILILVWSFTINGERMCRPIEIKIPASTMSSVGEWKCCQKLIWQLCGSNGPTRQKQSIGHFSHLGIRLLNEVAHNHHLLVTRILGRLIHKSTLFEDTFQLAKWSAVLWN